MQVKYVTKDGRLEFTFDAADDKEVFATLGKLQELYEEETVNIDGREISNEDVRYVVRQVGKFSFPEKRYGGKEKELRGYHKAFGQSENGLFPKRKDDEGNWLPNNGWTKWTPENGEKKEKEEAKPAKSGKSNVRF